MGKKLNNFCVGLFMIFSNKRTRRVLTHEEPPTFIQLENITTKLLIKL